MTSTCWATNERRTAGAALTRADQGAARQPPHAYCWEACQKVDRSQIVWGQIGPRLMAEAVGAAGVPVRILDPAAFNPIDYWNVWQLISANASSTRLLRDPPVEFTVAATSGWTPTPSTPQRAFTNNSSGDTGSSRHATRAGDRGGKALRGIGGGS